MLKASDSLLLVVDVQEKFRPVVPGIEEVIHRGQILMRAAQRLKIPMLASEQYPKGLGATVADLKQWLPDPGAYFPKLCFSAAAHDPLLEKIKASGRKQMVVFGVETHVCVLQTCLGLLERGFSVFVVADAVSSRKQIDRDMALRRMEKHGAELMTLEMALFEWVRVAGTAEFKEIQGLVK